MSNAQPRLADFIRPAAIRMPLSSSTLADAANELCNALHDAGALINVMLLRERIEEARIENVVGLSDRAFVLHYRTDAVDEIVVSIGISSQPIRRELADEEIQLARVVVLICSPPRKIARHLQLVGAFVRLLSRVEVVEELLGAGTVDEVVKLAPFLNFEVPAQLSVRELMTERPRSIDPDAPLRAAVLDMVRAGLGGLPVVDGDNRVIGILSERELLRDLLSHYLPRAGGAPASLPPSSSQRKVRDLMTRQVMCVAPEQPLAEVASLMLNKDVDRVPVVKDGRLVGFLTRSDIVRKLIGP